MIRLIDFRPEHAADLFEDSTGKASEGSKYILDVWLQRMALTDRSFSLIDNGHLIVAGGIFPVWDGLGEAWLIPSDRITRYRKSMISHLRRHIDRITKEDGLRRVQATVRADFPAAHRFLEFLGFDREGLMVSYGADGADHYLYARIS